MHHSLNVLYTIWYKHERNFVVKCEGDSLGRNQYITKPKEKNVGGHGILYSIPTVWKSGGRVLRVPHLIAPMGLSKEGKSTRRHKPTHNLNSK